MSGCNPASQFGPLPQEWSARTGGPNVARPVVQSGSVYVGSWDGYEYSLDEVSGTQKWLTYLGRSTAYCPQPDQLGVTSSPWLEGGMAYLGGGDSNWYALDSGTGAVRWTVPTGDSSPSGGHFNFSSPAVYNGYAYIGIASHCDRPLVQGELLRVNLGAHSIENVWKAVPDGQVGGTIWTNPVIDPVRRTVFVTTGTRVSVTPYAEAVVALDATTLAVKGYWALPYSDPTPDADWGTSPTLFTDSRGRDLVSAVNKNGILYAFDRDDVSAGPVWQTRIAEGGPAPETGDGSVSTGFFDGQRLYYAGGRTTVAGLKTAGSIRALDPGTGRILWERGLPSLVFGALTGAAGKVVVAGQSALYVVDGASGNVEWGNDLGQQIYGGAAIDGNTLFVVDVGGGIHAFEYPGGATAAFVRSRADAIDACWTAGASTMRCRLVDRRCTEIGTLPRSVRRFRVGRISIAARRLEDGPPATVRLYARSDCSARPALTFRLRDLRTKVGYRGRRFFPGGTSFTVSSSQPLSLLVRYSRGKSDLKIGNARRTGP